MRPIKMMTTKISLQQLGDAIFGDSLEARLSVGRIKKVSFDMIIQFFDKRLQCNVCETKHTIVFFDLRLGKFAHIPDEMMKVIVGYVEAGI